MSDWSYRYNKPRSEVHLERYGNTNVPLRRGLGGSNLAVTDSSGFWILAAIGGLLALNYLMKKS